MQLIDDVGLRPAPASKIAQVYSIGVHLGRQRLSALARVRLAITMRFTPALMQDALQSMRIHLAGTDEQGA